MKLLDTSYACVELNKDTLKISWKRRINPLQLKLVLQLVIENIERKHIHYLVEDQSELRLAYSKELRFWLTQFYFPTLEKYLHYYYCYSPNLWIDPLIPKSLRSRMIYLENELDLLAQSV